MDIASGGAELQVIWSDIGLHVMAVDPTESEWFTRFMNGIFSGIDERQKQDAAISMALMIEMQLYGVGIAAGSESKLQGTY